MCTNYFALLFFGIDSGLLALHNGQYFGPKFRRKTFWRRDIMTRNVWEENASECIFSANFLLILYTHFWGMIFLIDLNSFLFATIFLKMSNYSTRNQVAILEMLLLALLILRIIACSIAHSYNFKRKKSNHFTHYTHDITLKRVTSVGVHPPA